MAVYCSGLTKISVLLFYRRLAKDAITPTFKNIVRGAIALNIVLLLLWTGLLLGSCHPFKASWEQSDIVHFTSPYQCINIGLAILMYSVISTGTDFLTTLLPNMLIWKLNIRRTQKALLIMTFAFGYMSVLFSRAYFVGITCLFC